MITLRRLAICSLFSDMIVSPHLLGMHPRSTHRRVNKLYLGPHNIPNTLWPALSESRQVGTSRMGSARLMVGLRPHPTKNSGNINENYEHNIAKSGIISILTLPFRRFSFLAGKHCLCRGQGPEVRGQGPGVRGQGSGVRGQGPDSPIPEPRSPIPELCLWPVCSNMAKLISPVRDTAYFCLLCLLRLFRWV